MGTPTQPIAGGAASSPPDLAARITDLEKQVRALAGKGLLITIIAALLGSGGVTALANVYLSKRTLSLQERQAHNDSTQKSLQNRQAVVETSLKEQSLANEKLKAEQASFEANVKAYSTAVSRLKEEWTDANRTGNSAAARQLSDERQQQLAAFRQFIDLQARYVKEHPELPGWYRLGVEQARDIAAKLPR